MEVSHGDTKDCGSMIGQQCLAGFIRDIYFIPRGGSDCKLGVQEEGSGIDI